MAGAEQLLSDVLGALAQVVGQMRDWLASRGGAVLDGRGALVLLVGGLGMLALVVGMLSLRVVFLGGPEATRGAGRTGRRVVTELPPARLVRMEGARPAYRGPADEAYRRGRDSGAKLQAATLDEAVEGLAEAGVGHARVLRALRHRLVVRLYACAGCAREVDGAAPGCAFECGALEGALARVYAGGAVVRETICRRGQGGACDFEVWQ